MLWGAVREEANRKDKGARRMNKHIELVKKWLADPDSVTQEELDYNRDAAAYAADYVYHADFYEAAAYAAAAAAAYAAYATYAAYWVKRYEELTEQG